MVTEGVGPSRPLTDHRKSMLLNGNQNLKELMYKKDRAVASFGARRFLARRVHILFAISLQCIHCCHAQMYESLLAKLGREEVGGTS